MRLSARSLAASLMVSAVAWANQNPDRESSFQWKSALQQSALFLGIQHSFRMATEPGTRTNLKGPFVADYLRSVKAIRGWDDGDPFLVNYVGHPFGGAVAGYIEVQNDPKYRLEEFGKSGAYWKSRFRAMGFAAIYSTNFEIGPASEASLGNVAMGSSKPGMVDFVVTPLGGFGVMVAEDAMDRYVIQRLEKVAGNPVYRILVRSMLNPNRSFANMLRMKVPWYRDSRSGVLEP